MSRLWPAPGAKGVVLPAGSVQSVPPPLGAQEESFLYLEPPRNAVEDLYLFASAAPLPTDLSKLSGKKSSATASDEDELGLSWRNISVGESVRVGATDVRVTTAHGGVLVYHLRITHQKGEVGCPAGWKQ